MKDLGHIKDTKGGKRIQKLKEVMCNNIYDFNGEVITHIGQIVMILKNIIISLRNILL